MGFLFTILFFIFIYYIIRGLFFVNATKRKASDAFERMRREAEEDRRANRPGGWSNAKTPRRKKFDSSVGEYVAYEEITDNTAKHDTASNGSGTISGTDSRISDAEWEDIKS